MARFSKEQAVEALAEFSHMPTEHKAYYEAICDGKLPEYYQQEFFAKRFGYFDETPPVDVRHLIGDSLVLTQYKCQTNYVVGLTTAFRSALADEVITDPAIQEKIQEFLKSDLNFQVGDIQNQGRITRINNILDLVLAGFPSAK